MLKQGMYAAMGAARHVRRRNERVSDEPNLAVMQAVIAENREFERLDAVLAGLAQAALNHRADGGPRAIGVSSALRGEGKTTVAVGLATALAVRGDSEVLLIEGDLRTPSLAGDLQREAGPGLVECLQGDVGESEIVQPTPIEHLSIMAAGQPSDAPMSLLTKPGLGELVKTMRSRYAYLVLDMPAVLERSEAVRWAELVDEVILVVEAGRASKEVVADAVAAIGRDKLSGVVLNRSRSSTPHWLSRILTPEAGTLRPYRS